MIHKDDIILHFLLEQSYFDNAYTSSPHPHTSKATLLSFAGLLYPQQSTCYISRVRCSWTSVHSEKNLFAVGLDSCSCWTEPVCKIRTDISSVGTGGRVRRESGTAATAKGSSNRKQSITANNTYYKTVADSAGLLSVMEDASFLKYNALNIVT